MALRADGSRKASSVLFCAIESSASELASISACSEGKRKKALEELVRNSKAISKHFLPKSTQYPGGFVNFSNIEFVEIPRLTTEYESLSLIVAPEFIKDIQARFSAYYARPGQPELDVTKLM